MAKKQLNSGYTTISLLSGYRIKTAFAEVALVPHEGIDQRYFQVMCMTEDDWRLWQNATFLVNGGISVKVEFQHYWENSDGRFDHELDRLCRKMYNMPYSKVRTIWASRTEGRLSNSWHLIKMERVG